jgi:hypothetical protein
MENVGIFYDQLECFTVPTYFAIFQCHLVIWYIFPRFGIFYQENSGNHAYVGHLLPDSSNLIPNLRLTAASRVKDAYFQRAKTVAGLLDEELSRLINDRQQRLSYTKLSYSNYSVNFIRAHGLIQVQKDISSNPST